jgi:deazaflavin-dependent oxidoreductase (nitroreductase family)
LYGLKWAGADELDSGMQLSQRLARFNRHVTNPIQRMWAGWAPSFAIIEHVGRRSGKPYRTPVNALTATIDGKPGVAILLTYGPDRDWLKNITAAGAGRIRRNGKTFGITDPQVVTKAEAASHVVRGRRIFARLPFEQAVLFTLTP